MSHGVALLASMTTRAIPLLAGALGGTLLGIPYFAAVRRSAAALLSRANPVIVISATLARIAAAVAGFAWAARYGAGVPIAGLLGFLLARTAAIAKSREPG